MSREREFKSFRSLRRADGEDGERPTEQKPDKGWTLESDHGPYTEEEGLGAESSRDRIGARPQGFGPMDIGESGPPAYADPESDELRLLESFRLRTVFPKDVLSEADALPDDPDPAQYGERLDLRAKTIFTIDGEDARDFDDAVSIEEGPAGTVRLGVHIADVSHYVRPGTALDAEALARGTSVYLPDQVIPMLPEKLSNGLCSLVGGRDRFAYSVCMTFAAVGTRLEATVHKSVIKSARRNTYREVQDVLDGAAVSDPDLARLEPDLRLFQRWTKRQQAIRDAKGSLRTQSSERKFVFDDQHEVSGVVEVQKLFAHTLIEETALAANQAVGDLFRSRGLPTIYRIHPEKDEEEVAGVIKLLADHGIRVPNKDRLTGRDIGRLIRTARNRPNAEALIQRIMGLVERAFYEVRDHEDVARHFGLAREAYLHFTSPIRRYPDLIVHRWLGAVESRGEEAARELRTDELVQDLNDTAAHCSIQSELAEMAAMAIHDLKVCQYLDPHVGEKVDATVLRVSMAGMEVRLSNFGVSGFLPSRILGDHPKVSGPNLLIRKGRRSLSFTEGHPVRVQIGEVDFLKLQVLLELA
jgi:ribonuclease R